MKYRATAKNIGMVPTRKRGYVKGILMHYVIEESEIILDAVLMRLGITSEETIRSIKSSMRFSKTSEGIEIEVEPGSAAYWHDRGWPSYDMKPILLSSDRAKTGKLGHRYVDVPMSGNMRTHLVSKESSGQDINEMTLARFKRNSMRNTQVAEDIGTSLQAMAKMNWEGSRKLTSISTRNRENDKYWGKFTFRRVSDMSRPSSWIHPGRPRLNFISSIRTEVEARLTRYIEALFT